MLTCFSEGVEALVEYHEAIGGKPETGKKRKGRQSGVKSESGTPVSAKRMKKERQWSPPPGSWEDDVDHVDTVEQRIDPKTGRPEKFGYLVWKHHVKTQHPLPLIFKKCPQKVGFRNAQCQFEQCLLDIDARILRRAPRLQRGAG